MPFSKVQLKSDIKAAFASAKSNTDDPEAAFDAVAEAIADAVATQVKAGVESAIIAYSAGLTSPSGPVAGVFNNTITFTVV